MRARDLLTPVLLLLAAGCATQDVGEPPPAPPQAVDGPAAQPAERLDVERAELEADDDLGLAEYERLLADKEDRLRAAGVLLAVREELARPEDRFAPPPPVGGTVVGGASRDRDVATAKAAKSKRTEAAGAGMGDSGRAAGATAPPAPAPTRRPTTTSRSDAAPTSKPAPAADARTAAEDEAQTNRCPTICDLSAATCDLEGKICDLAQRHPGDPRYADLCRRADDDCRLAAEACQRCSP